MRTKIIFKRLNAYISLCLVMLLHVGVVTAQNTSPLCFSARNGSVTVRFDIKNVTHTIQYSTDSVNWNTYTSNSDLVLNANQSVYFRAESNQTYASAFGANNDINCSRFYFTSSNGGTVEGSGNIMSLYGPDCPNLPLSYNNFNFLFYGCTTLTTAPSLPITSLASNCYHYMFCGCTALTKAPSLPATTLADYCYCGMFCGCTAITTAPSLPTTTLADHCYASMFNGCTALTTAPSLPATTLSQFCYYNMFSGCISLKVVPLLPATTLAYYCYNNMFNGCTSIIMNTTSPGQPWIITSTTTDSYALSDMFTGTGGTMNGTPSINTTYYLYGYNITANVNDTSMGSVTGTGFFRPGSRRDLTAIPNAHYHFVSWSDGNTSNPRYVILNGDTSFTAIFEGDMQTISAYGQNGTVIGGGQYHYGSTATLTATANQHYNFARWSDGDISNPRTVAVYGDATYTAIFEGDLQTISVGGTNGTVSGAGQYNYGSTATLIATANQHYHFARWSDGNTQNPRTVTVSGNATYTAVFEIDKHTVALVGDNGTFTGGGIYDYGTTVTLTATPDEHFYFSRWTDWNTDNPRNVVVTADITYTAIMEGELHTVAATCEHGEVTGSGTYHYSDIVTLVVIPDKGYKFIEWSDGNEYNPRVFVVEGDLEVEAICEAVTGVEDVEESVAFYYVRGRVVNPEEVMLRVYSTEGKMVKSGDGDIETEGMPAGMYMVVDERGNSIKIVIMHNKI